MGTDESYYDLLGVDPDASTTEIKAAYRKKAKQHHPDISDHPDAEKIFKTLTTAKETLTNPKKRKQYDRNRTATPSHPQTQSPSSTTTTTHRNRHANTPDPDDWVGSPRWSTQTNTTNTTNTTRTTDRTWESTPSYVIPTPYLQSTILATLTIYLTVTYTVFAPTPPIFSLIGTVTLPLLFLTITSTRLGFYVFPLTFILTPLLLVLTGSLDPSSLKLLIATMIPIFGFIITLLVTATQSTR